MTSLPVTPIEDARLKRQFAALQASVDPQGLFDIPFQDVAQAVDVANASKADPIHLGTEAQLAVQRLMEEFGVPGRLPATYGELMGLVFYCKQLHDAVHFPRLGTDDDALMEACVDESFREYAPQMHPSYVAYKMHNMEELRRIHQERFTLKAMSHHFDFEHGWVHGQLDE